MESRLGSWRAIALTPLISVGACAGLAAWDSIYAFAFVPMAAAAGTVRVLLVSQYINNRIPSGQRATIMSIYALAGALANSFCAPAFGYIADERSLRFLFGTVAVFGSLTLPLLLFLWRRAERREEGLGNGGAASADAQG
jgi:predicted MFS family arabinose efflux permease